MLSQMRARLCVDPKLQRLFSTGQFDSTVTISSLQGDAAQSRLHYNGRNEEGGSSLAVVGTCIALTEDATEVIVGSREGLVIVWNIE